MQAPRRTRQSSCISGHRRYPHPVQWHKSPPKKRAAARCGRATIGVTWFRSSRYCRKLFHCNTYQGCVVIVAGRDQIQGWKEIAAYLGRDERTVKRWEKQRGLPVRRIPGKGRANVYILVAELDAWLATSSMIVPSDSGLPSAFGSEPFANLSPEAQGDAPVAPLALAQIVLSLADNPPPPDDGDDTDDPCLERPPVRAAARRVHPAHPLCALASHLCLRPCHPRHCSAHGAWCRLALPARLGKGQPAPHPRPASALRLHQPCRQRALPRRGLPLRAANPCLARAGSSHL